MLSRGRANGEARGLGGGQRFDGGEGDVGWGGEFDLGGDGPMRLPIRSNASSHREDRWAPSAESGSRSLLGSFCWAPVL